MSHTPKISRKFRIILALIITLFITMAVMLSFVASPYFISFFAFLFMYIAIAQCWNIFSGYTGYWSMGHHAFIGIGSYSMAILTTRYGFSEYLIFPICGLTAILIALIFSTFALRIRGSYFTICSLAFAEMLKILALNLYWLTRGGEGILLTPKYRLYEFYFQMLIIAVGLTILAYYIKRSSLGYALFAIKNDEEAARAVGINTNYYKVLILMISSFFLGIIGGFYVMYIVYVDPYVAFSEIHLVVAILSTVLGGMGEWEGPILGALIFVPLMEYLWISFPYVYLIILGLSLILIIRFMPAGLINYVYMVKNYIGRKLRERK